MHLDMPLEQLRHRARLAAIVTRDPGGSAA